MEQKEIIEGNKLIAEFMDYRLVDCHSPFLGKKWTKENLNDSPLYNLVESCKEDNLRFHNSWDWLMPVLIKIQESYQGEEHHIKSCELHDDITSMLRELKIEWVWQSVIKFIKWYNSITAVAVTPNEVQK